MTDFTSDFTEDSIMSYNSGPPPTDSDDELIARVREGLEYNLHWLEAYYGIVEPDAEAKTNRRLSVSSLEALDTLARRLKELKDGIIAVEAADEAWKQVGDVDQLPTALGALYSLLHPEPQGAET
jgi:hypothetical protein